MFFLRMPSDKAHASVVVDIIHLELGILNEIIIREFDAVKLTVLKHQVVLTEAPALYERQQYHCGAYHEIIQKLLHTL